MTRGAIFWMLMILWVVFSIWSWWPDGRPINYPFVGGSVLQIVLFALLGWQVYGPAIKG